MSTAVFFFVDRSYPFFPQTDTLRFCAAYVFDKCHSFFSLAIHYGHYMPAIFLTNPIADRPPTSLTGHAAQPTNFRRDGVSDEQADHCDSLGFSGASHSLGSNLVRQTTTGNLAPVGGFRSLWRWLEAETCVSFFSSSTLSLSLSFGANKQLGLIWFRDADERNKPLGFGLKK